VSEFNLDPQAVAQTETLLHDTGEAVEAEARAVVDEITGISGTGWTGNANAAAVNQQVGAFTDAQRRLFNEISHISEALGMGRFTVTAQEEDSEQAFQLITPEVGNFGRL
jgi:hypothetical protein